MLPPFEIAKDGAAIRARSIRAVWYDLTVNVAASGLVYYNDCDPYCCEWLENLIAADLLPNGVVDCRPIEQVDPADLEVFTQCHFFAGIGGWPLALQMARIGVDVPVWTGSCPCQPFSNIGLKKGFADERHLWPAWFRLIRQLNPPTVFGEQVAGASVWLDLVLTDLESAGYACGAAALPAAGVGARHERERLWFVAHADSAGRQDVAGVEAAEEEAQIRPPSGVVDRPQARRLCGPVEPFKDWIVDGLRGEGRAVSAFGNAIVPQVAAEFITAAYQAIRQTLK